MSVAVDLGRVEAAIESAEKNLGWTFPLPARTTIYQLFISLSSDEGGYEKEMNDNLRENALSLAFSGLDDFLQQIVQRSITVAGRSQYTGSKVGFPIVIKELDSWAARIKCHCWPR